MASPRTLLKAKLKNIPSITNLSINLLPILSAV